MSKRHLAWLVVVPLLVFAALVWSVTAPPAERDYQHISTIVDVLAKVDEQYYRKLSDAERQQLVEDMIHGGLQKLDRYSAYFNEEQLKQFNAETRGNFSGIGAYLGPDPKTGQLMVDSPMPDSPALDAGLQHGDLIIAVDGTSTEKLTFDEARSLIKGEAGTKVSLKIRRANVDDFEVTLVRAVIQVHPVKGYQRKADDPKQWDYMLDAQAGIAIIRLNEFSESALKEMQAALAAADQAGAKALILDLRGNPGGLLNMAEKISDLFLAEGIIVRTRDRSDAGRNEKANNDNSHWESTIKRPMAVLVNGMSASAAEIVAAALQDNGRAVVIGDRTFGKGSVQQSMLFADEKAAIKLTTQIWLTPNGRHIDRGVTARPGEPGAKPNEWGVAPDAGFEVTLTEEQYIQYLLHLRHADLLQHAKPAEPGKAPIPGELPALDPNFKDPVEEKALEYLRNKLKGIGRLLPGQLTA